MENPTIETILERVFGSRYLWEETINPGLEGRLISSLILELEQELGPQDNFTLQLEIPDDS